MNKAHIKYINVKVSNKNKINKFIDNCSLKKKNLNYKLYKLSPSTGTVLKTDRKHFGGKNDFHKFVIISCIYFEIL